MTKQALLSFLLIFLCFPVYAQNVSNEGKLFWVGHMGHIDGTGSNFALYITTDAATSALVRVSIPGGTYNQLHVIPSNQVVVVTLPSSQTYMNCTDCIRNQGVKIESMNHDVVVYAHIYSNARSDATLLIPVETLGKEYYALAFTQSPVSTTQRSEFMLVGVEDSTYVDIYPTVDILPSKTTGVKYTVMLNTGEVYHAQSNSDVTGTRIVARSANGISCKKIAAFSGSSFTRVGCAGASTGDNLYQQLFPTTSWGMEFVTAPLKTRNGDQFRVLAKYDSTKILINGGTPQYLNEGEYYSFVSTTPNYVQADKPVTFAQYPRTQNCDGVTGDPTLIVIPPIEQMVKYVAMYSSPYQNITGQYLNIITRTSDTSKFRLDGQKILFTSMSNKPQFAYAMQTVNSGIHRMISDSFFQVVAYGFGNVEAYGYAGGTNIKNLVQSISASRDSMCLGDTLTLKAEVNYIPTSMSWYFGDGTTDTVNLIHKHVYSAPGEYIVSLVTRKEGMVDCGSTDSTVYRVRVHGYPRASFAIGENCLSDTFHFQDLSDPATTKSYVSKWNWTFGDSITSIAQNPIRYFNRIDSFPVQLVVWNNNLCSDTVYGAHFVNPDPEPAIVKNDTCPGLPAFFIDQSSIDQGAITLFLWQFDSATMRLGQLVSFGSPDPGTHFLDLFLKSDSGCTATYRDSFVVYEQPVASFSVTNTCYGAPIVVNDSSILAETYFWDYSDTTFIGAAKPYLFSDTGTYTLKLTVRSFNGCLDSTMEQVSIYPNPYAKWGSQGTCANDRYRFIPEFDTIPYSSWSYNWLIDGNSLTGAGQEYSFPAAGSKQISLRVSSPDLCETTFNGTVYVNPHPVATPFYQKNCAGQPGQLIDQSDYTGSNSFYHRWTWGGLTYYDSVKSIIPNAVMPATAMLLVITDSNCSDSAIVNLPVIPLPTADFSTTGECPESQVVHDDRSVSGLNDPLVLRQWSLNGIQSGNLDSFIWTPTQGGDYLVELQVISLAGCRDTLVQNIHILDKPLAKVKTYPSCVEFLAELEDQSTLAGHTINQWDWLWDGKTYSGKRIGETFLTPGYYSYSLNLGTDAGCVFMDVFADSIFIAPKPTAQFVSNRPFSLMDDPVFTFTNQSVGASVNLWNFGDGTLSSDISPIHSYSDTGIWWVKLKVENKFGCTDSATGSVRIRPMLECYIPNVITPNGDGINDLFEPVCEGLEVYEIYIHNRWGQQIYHSTNSEPWKPYSEEYRAIPEGIYVYTMVLRDYLGNPKYYKGTIVLLR
ncbi:MAG: PKD domain-containing protein [Bacteroidia bacterium]